MACAWPQSEEWLLIEWPEGQEKPSHYWLSTFPEEAAYKELAFAAKVRWRIELARSISSAKRLKFKEGPPRMHVEPEDAEKIVHCLMDDEHWPLWAAYLFTGVRPSEIRALTWPDVELTKGLSYNVPAAVAQIWPRSSKSA